MAGHSKFKNIQYRKGAQDKKRAKLFAKISKEITVAAKLGMPDPASNPRLRSAISLARSQNMPKDNIERAIKKSSDENSETYEEVRYEGFGPSGVGIIVETLTDNRNRTAGDIRAIFSKCGGNLGENGSVSFMFDKVGQIIYPKSVADADTMFDVALEAGADNVETEEDAHIITTTAEDFNFVRENMERHYSTPEEAGLIWQPQNIISVEETNATTLIKLYDTLDENEDVQNVFANFDISDEVIKKLDG